MTEIHLPILNFPKQETIFDKFNQGYRYVIVHKGRRFGLTVGASNKIIEWSLEGKYKRMLWIDTVNSNIDRYVERLFIPKLKVLPSTVYWEWKKQAKTLYIKDAYIDFRSADNPESIEGFAYEFLFLNEAGIILKDEYLWDNAVRPMLWDYKAPALIGGAPKGGGKFKELADRGKDPAQTQYTTLQFSTFDNPYIDPSLIKEEIKSMPERVVKQEIYGEFLDDSGTVFRNVREIATARPQAPIQDHIYVLGVDLAKHQDWTVITVYDRSTNKQVYHDRFQHLEWPFQKKKIAEISNHYNRALVSIDATGIGDPIVDDLLRAGIPVEPIKLTNEIKKEIIEKQVIWFEQRKVELLPIPEAISEYTSFTYDITGTGKVRYEAPQGFHDDIVIANGLAIWQLQPLYDIKIVKQETPIAKYYKRLTENLTDAEHEGILNEWAQDGF